MDPSAVLVATAGFIGSCVAQKCADATLLMVWQKLKTLFQGAHSEAQPSDFTSAVHWDQAVLEEVERVFSSNSALRRAKLVAPVLSGARVLWIDDQPDNNVWERSMFGAFGIQCKLATSTAEGLAALVERQFQAVLSDIGREGRRDEGLRALPILRQEAPETPVVIYTGRVRRDLPVPHGAFGITDRPDDLLHLLLDILERVRV